MFSSCYFLLVCYYYFATVTAECIVTVTVAHTLNSCSLLLLLKLNIHDALYGIRVSIKRMFVAKKKYNLPYKYQTKSCTTHKTTLFFFFSFTCLVEVEITFKKSFYTNWIIMNSTLPIRFFKYFEGEWSWCWRREIVGF